MRNSLMRIPQMVRIKPGSLDRLGLYLARSGHTSIMLITSQGILPVLLHKAQTSLDAQEIALLATHEAAEQSFEEATSLLGKVPFGCQAIIALGGAKVLETAKYVATMASLPYYAVPTSLSSDGFCSPYAHLPVLGRRRILSCDLPYALIIDNEVCRMAPANLWCAGVGDMIAKLTAVADWRLAFHSRGAVMHDFASMLSDSVIQQFAEHPERDHEGIRLLATGLMLNGIATDIAGNSRPVAGSEHLIAQALDRVSPIPRLHGLSVGCATYIVSHLQGSNAALIGTLLERAGFWDVLKQDPFLMGEWRQAVMLAPTMRNDYYTILSHRDCWPEIEKLLKTDPYLSRVFVGHGG